jgi:hypothetical protein
MAPTDRQYTTDTSWMQLPVGFTALHASTQRAGAVLVPGRLSRHETDPLSNGLCGVCATCASLITEID